MAVGNAPQEHMSARGPVRIATDPVTTAAQLGPLASLAGSWAGKGFNQIWRPDNTQPPENSKIRRFLELNRTSEAFQFDVIPGVVPNRGVADQPDLSLFGLHYLQQVSDADDPPFSTAGQALHIEPGFFMNVPASITPPNPASIVRLASIPHGVSLLFQGDAPSADPVPGPPNIPPIFPIPELPTFTPETPPFTQPPGPPIPPPTGPLGLGIQPTVIPPPPAGQSALHPVPEVYIAADVVGSQSNGPYPSDFQGFINDPNSVLRQDLQGQNILGTITIELSTENVADSIGNIPFLGIPNPADAQNPNTPNAFVSSARATFWIEFVEVTNPHPGNNPPPGQGPFPGQPHFLQFQYSQLSILVFNGVLWPHVNVATLRLSNG